MTEIVVAATYHYPKERIALTNFIKMLETALTMCIDDEIPYNHPLFLRELAIRVDKDAEHISSDNDRLINVVRPALGKKISMSISDRNQLKVVLEKSPVTRLFVGDLATHKPPIRKWFCFR